MSKRYRLLIAIVMVGAGCKGHEFHPPSQEERVAQADSLYATMRFDTVHWASDSARLAMGNEVYAAKCDKCHGPTGEGGTEYAQSQHLEPKSLVRSDWEYGDDREAVRRRIFTGHPAGMPTWGVGKDITPREIDAVTSYIMERLRPEAASAAQ
ncbi:MAG TPA: c-type cytochrome [Longimicrobiales bacterium]